ncbi:MAG: hypothetical protein AVDCRST_MAG32-2395 [uncultured Nocardioides sp.]|uniref:DUF5667 domain-containing protein n=1 Tax=uncultured Nocardioides sp. TaxID=198441 RepID=A0A6J4NM98_9ACTN|nr:MAG: hypothetical protein AVDCRST_MAG32-2395 [uncultured Nocardioides sp.]
MTPVFSARRRADEFEALVSRRLDGPPDERAADRYGDLLTLVGELRSVPGPTPRADFAADLRERLMLEADTVLLRVPASTAHEKLALPVRSRSDRRFAAVLGSAAMVGATATVAVAAQTALPGESLYPVKQAMEAAEHRLASDDAGRGRALLASAEHRLTELEALAAEDRTGADSLIPDTLDQFSDQSEDAATALLDAYDATGDPAVVDELRAFAADSMDRLAAMESSFPSSARDELLAAGRRLADLDASAAAACPVCDGGIGEVPSFLLTPVASRNLLVGLDRDRVQLDPSPVSGQDVEGIVVPPALQVPAEPDNGQDAGGSGASGGSGDSGGSTAGSGGSGGTGGGDGVKGTVDGTVKDPTGTVKGTVEDPTGTVEETVDTVTGAAGETTGGAVGGLTEGVDDATGGLIGDVTGTIGEAPTTGVPLP